MNFVIRSSVSRNLEKKFGEHEVLKDISFDLFEGDVVCIIGSPDQENLHY